MGIQGDCNDWREDMIEVLNDFITRGAKKVRWFSAQDEHVCPLCKEKDGTIYTIEETIEALKDEFCKPGDPDDRCRCTFLRADYEDKND